jgi:hypothetical protein
MGPANLIQRNLAPRVMLSVSNEVRVYTTSTSGGVEERLILSIFRAF